MDNNVNKSSRDKMEKSQPKEIYFRHLPHFQPLGYTFFITFRLKDSMPGEVLFELRRELWTEIEKLTRIENKDEYVLAKRLLYSKYFAKFDSILDASDYSANYLADTAVARIVVQEIHKYDENGYDLIAYTIMPNHVHLIFSIEDELNEGNIDDENPQNNILYAPATDYLKKIKGATARYCNKYLGRNGGFWQQESYDHVIRNSEQLNKAIRYVLNNPVKAGLCEQWSDWKYSYCKYTK